MLLNNRARKTIGVYFMGFPYRRICRYKYIYIHASIYVYIF